MARLRLRWSKSKIFLYKEFRKKYINSYCEHAYVISEDGKLEQICKGNENSVEVNDESKNSLIIHNHPEGGNVEISREDLIAIANSVAAELITCTKEHDYFFAKAKSFKKKNFLAALEQVDDEQINEWLIFNQRRYKYKYVIA